MCRCWHRSISRESRRHRHPFGLWPGCCSLARRLSPLISVGFQASPLLMGAISVGRAQPVQGNASPARTRNERSFAPHKLIGQPRGKRRVFRPSRIGGCRQHWGLQLIVLERLLWVDLAVPTATYMTFGWASPLACCSATWCLNEPRTWHCPQRCILVIGVADAASKDGLGLSQFQDQHGRPVRQQVSG